MVIWLIGKSFQHLYSDVIIQILYKKSINSNKNQPDNKHEENSSICNDGHYIIYQYSQASTANTLRANISDVFALVFLSVKSIRQ